MMIAHSIDSVKHDSQGVVQAEAHNKIFEALGIAEKVEQIVEEFAESVLPYSGTMPESREQARRWAVEALVDYIAALADYNEVLLIE